MSLSRLIGPELSLFRHSSPFGMLGPHLFASHQQSGLLFPKLDYVTDKDSIRISVDVPGVDKKDLDINLEGDMLTISGQINRETQPDDKDSSYKLYEREFGAFRRQVQVPYGLTEQDIKAKMDNGVLKIELPKKTEMTEAKKINID